jgi:SNF2 family DNA or RNA helicase
MDTLIPGCFGLRTLKEFAEEYSADKVDNLKKLSNRLLKRKDDLPPPILRRMKSDIAKDLPKKIEQPLIEEMKPAQADAYKKCIDMRKAEQIDALTMIQSLKKISIHSEDIDSEMAEDANKYVNGSSKYIALFKILDEAYSKNEKVLVFVEYKNLHEWLSVYIKHRYKMNHFPNRIFGSVSAEERTNIVERFQEAGSGFDLLLLSPKAAGVGLTLTAASKVVHFTRWWNPAVEDQCTDRAYRIGQKNDVTVYYPISEHPIFGEGSFDFILDALLNQKRSLSKEVLMPVINNQELEDIEDKLINLTQ